MPQQKTTNDAPDLDFALVKEFEYRKKKIELLEQGRLAYEKITETLNNEDSIDVVREAALSFAKGGIEQAIENVDNAIIALTSARKFQTALNAVKFLLLLLVISNVLTAFVAWLILR